MATEDIEFGLDITNGELTDFWTSRDPDGEPQSNDVNKRNAQAWAISLISLKYIQLAYSEREQKGKLVMCGPASQSPMRGLYSVLTQTVGYIKARLGEAYSESDIEGKGDPKRDVALYIYRHLFDLHKDSCKIKDSAKSIKIKLRNEHGELVECNFNIKVRIFRQNRDLSTKEELSALLKELYLKQKEDWKININGSRWAFPDLKTFFDIVPEVERPMDFDLPLDLVDEIGETKIRDWLHSYPDFDPEILTKLLETVWKNYYFNEENYAEICGLISLRLKSVLTENVKDEEIGKVKEKWLFTSLDSTIYGRSEEFRERLKEGLDLADRHFTNIDSLKNNMLKGETLILYDTFCGSGGTAVSALKKLAELNYQPEALCLALLAGFKEGLKEIVNTVALTLPDTKLCIFVGEHLFRQKNEETHVEFAEGIALFEVKQSARGIATLPKTILDEGDKAFDGHYDGLNDEERRKLQLLCIDQHDRIKIENNPIRKKYIDTQSLVVFYDYTPDNAIPVLWMEAEAEGITPVFLKNRPFFNQIPKIPDLYNRIEELSELEGFYAQKKTIIITGPDGVGKSSLISRFIRDNLGEFDAADRVFWHPMRRFSTYSYLFQQLVDYAHYHASQGEAQDIRIPQDARVPKELAKHVLNKFANHIIVLDRLNDVSGEKYLTAAFLRELILNPNSEGPFVVFISRDSHGDFCKLIQLDRKELLPEIKLENFSKDESQGYIQNELDLTTVPAKEIQKRGLGGHPLIVALLIFLYRLCEKKSTGIASSDETLFDKAIERFDKESDRKMAVIKTVWDELDPSIRRFLAIISAFIPPRKISRIDEFLDGINRIIDARPDPEEKLSVVSLKEAEEYFENLPNPFYSLVGEGRFRVCQMTPMIRELIQNAFEKGVIAIEPNIFNFSYIHRAIASFFRSKIWALLKANDPGNRREAADLIAFRHYHFKQIVDHKGCLDNILNHKDYFRNSAYAECLLDLVRDLKANLSYTELLSAVERYSQQDRTPSSAKSLRMIGILLEEGKLKDLAYAEIDLCKSITRPADERKVADEWLAFFKDRRLREYLGIEKIDKVKFNYFKALEAKDLAHYKEAVDAHAESIRELDELGEKEMTEEEELDCFVWRCKSMARLAQTYMTLSDYPSATEAISEMGRAISQQLAQNVEVSVVGSEWQKAISKAMAHYTRHLHTIHYLLGHPEDAKFWIEVCTRINRAAGEELGEFIGQYKLAHCAWLKTRMTWMPDLEGRKSLIDDAIRIVKAARDDLVGKCSGSAWWHMAFDDLIAHLSIDGIRMHRKRQVGHSDSDDEVIKAYQETARAAVQGCEQTLFVAKACVSDSDEVLKKSLMKVRGLENRLAHVKLLVELDGDRRGDMEAEFKVFEQVYEEAKEIYKYDEVGSSPYFVGVVRYENGYSLYRHGQVEKAFEMFKEAIDIFTEAGLYRIVNLPVFRMVMSDASRLDIEQRLFYQISAAHIGVEICRIQEREGKKAESCLSFGSHYDEELNRHLSELFQQLEPDRIGRVVRKLRRYFEGQQAAHEGKLVEKLLKACTIDGDLKDEIKSWQELAGRKSPLEFGMGYERMEQLQKWYIESQDGSVSSNGTFCEHHSVWNSYYEEVLLIQEDGATGD